LVAPEVEVWQTAQLPIAASSAPFLTRSELKADALAGSMGSICGFHTSSAPATKTTATMTNIEVINLRPVIEGLARGPSASLSSGARQHLTQTP